jgi:hypothetical protein
MRLLWVALLSSFCLQAAVEGVVINGTTGRPQAGVALSLLRLGQGMERLAATTSGSDGRFRFEQELAPGAPHLVQARYQDVNYSKTLAPGSPTGAIEIQVFETTTDPSVAQVSQHMILLEPSEGQIAVNETILMENSSRKTFYDARNGALRFYLPPEARGKVRVNATGPQGMPLERPAQPTGEPNVYRIDFPVRPGETRFDLAYTLSGSATEFRSRILHEGPVKLVAPRGVTLSGPGLKDLGPEPRTQATIYDVSSRQLEVKLAGSGTLRAGAEAAQQDVQPRIEQRMPRLYDRLPLLLVLIGGILVTGFVLLYRSSPAR